MMDEVNIVRNVYERNFVQLLHPLNYEQFAPPLFLWVLKLSGLLFNYGEKTMRFFPIACSCLSLILFYRLLRKTECDRAFWYPLALFAFSGIYLLYGNDVKQYASDGAITLSLLLAFYRTNLFNTNPATFIFSCGLAGGTAIWMSMPSVFVLTGIGISFFLQALKLKKTSFFLSVIGVGAIWLLLFILYFKLLLQSQINSDYLQQFHAPYFLNAKSFEDLSSQQNVSLLLSLFTANTGTAIPVFLFFNFLLLLLGIIKIVREDWVKSISQITPLICLLVAAALHSFTLIPRVCIFIMPLVLLIIGHGLEFVFSFGKKVQIAFTGLCLLSIACAQQFQLFFERNEVDELTKGIAFARAQNVSFENIYIPELYQPCVIYYTSIHPNRKRAVAYRRLSILHSGANLNKVREGIKGRAAFVYFWIDDATMQTHRDSIFSYLHPVDSLIRPSYKSLVFEK